MVRIKQQNEIFYVAADGQCRTNGLVARARQSRKAEAKARSAVLNAAQPPEECSSEIHAAPARGRVRPFKEKTVVPVGTDDFKVSEVRYKSGCAGQTRDVFDAMADQAKRRRGAPTFTPAQVAAGRAYGALVERLESAGIKCSSAFDLATGDGSGRDFMDAVIHDRQRLDWFHRAIGDDVAQQSRRKTPARAGRRVVGDVDVRAIGRKIITVRALVDGVCLRQEPLSRILERHGWTRGGKNQMTLRAALGDALERMQSI